MAEKWQKNGEIEPKSAWNGQNEGKGVL